jgi:hypothetical protein
MLGVLWRRFEREKDENTQENNTFLSHSIVAREIVTSLIYITSSHSFFARVA